MPIFEHNGKYGLFIHIPKTGGKSVMEYLKDAGCSVSFIHNVSYALGFADINDTLTIMNKVPCEVLQERGRRHVNLSALDPFSPPASATRPWPTGVKQHGWNLPAAPQHVQGDILESLLRLDKISWIFTVVRDPIERCVSHYRSQNMETDFDSWIKGTREQWKKNPYHADNHFRPQVDFIVPRCKVFTYPHYHELINYLEIEVGLPKSEFKKIGPSSAPLPQISPESESLIKEWYCNDYELFFGGSGEIYDSQRRISFNYHSPPCALV